MRIEEVIGERLREARVAAGFSQEEFGRFLESGQGRERGWTRQSVLNAELGRRPFGISDLIGMAVALERPVTWFVMPSKSRARIEIGPDLSLTAPRLRALFERQPLSSIDEVVRLTTDVNEAAAAIEESAYTVKAKVADADGALGELLLEIADLADQVARLQELAGSRVDLGTRLKQTSDTEGNK